MASKIKVDQIQTADGTGTIALQNQLSGMTNASMPTGSSLQTKHMFTNDSSGQSVTSTSFIDVANLTLNITPASTSNKVLVQANLHSYLVSHSTDGWNACDFQIIRRIGGSDTVAFESFKDDGSGHGYTAGAYVRDDETRFMWVTPIHFLDSPNTTSEITYKVKVRAKDSNFTVTFNDTYCRCSIVLQEIKG